MKNQQAKPDLPDQARAVIVIKQDPSGRETWRYPGIILEQSENCVVVEAFFNRPDLPFHGIVLANGDRFVEQYYPDRWYNINEIYGWEDGVFKGWYCNVSFPAEIRAGEIAYRDLALDLLVYPDGKQLVLDRDEFEALPLSPEVRQQAEQALAELKKRFDSQKPRI